ncbi:MAG TPA: PEGA domain-containing protein [Lacipirellulaceae bacterium]|nr:PEGA domain-containing protein [Lacipirellulaceae bacterium]
MGWSPAEHRDRASRRLLAWMAIAALVLAPGCVRRRLVVRSNPPGATVYVDNQPIGTTPCATSFVYYGTREIRLVKPGYETLTVKQPIPAPWYQIPPLDFASENLTPNEIHDFRTVTYNLTPQVIVPPEQIIARGDQLRAASQMGNVVPAAVGAGGPPVGPPTAVSPLGPPTAVSPLGPVITSPMAPLEPLGPGVLLPSIPGAGTLPPGGRPLEPLPTPQ